MKISLRVKINQQIMIHLIIKKLMKILFMKFPKIIFLIIKTMKLKYLIIKKIITKLKYLMIIILIIMILII